MHLSLLKFSQISLFQIVEKEKFIPLTTEIKENKKIDIKPSACTKCANDASQTFLEKQKKIGKIFF